MYSITIIVDRISRGELLFEERKLFDILCVLKISNKVCIYTYPRA